MQAAIEKKPCLLVEMSVIKSFPVMLFMSIVYLLMSQELLMKQKVLIILEFGRLNEIKKCGIYYSESCGELFKKL